MSEELDVVTWKGRNRFCVNYILTCDEDEPDIGDSFKVIVGAYCEGGRSTNAKQLILDPEKPDWREQNQKVWESLWIGGHHQLQDLGEVDTAKLSKLLIDSVDATYELFRSKIAAFETTTRQRMK